MVISQLLREEYKTISYSTTVAWVLISPKVPTQFGKHAARVSNEKDYGIQSHWNFITFTEKKKCFTDSAVVDDKIPMPPLMRSLLHFNSGQM